MHLHGQGGVANWMYKKEKQETRLTVSVLSGQRRCLRVGTGGAGKGGVCCRDDRTASTLACWLEALGGFQEVVGNKLRNSAERPEHSLSRESGTEGSEKPASAHQKLL